MHTIWAGLLANIKNFEKCPHLGIKIFVFYSILSEI